MQKLLKESLWSQMMKMSSLVDRLFYSFLLIFSSFLIVCVSGIHKDLSPPCEVALLVKRMTLKTLPKKPVTIECPLRHCGKSLNVTWCKILDKDPCEPMSETENVEITQTKQGKNKLISRLTFKQISIQDKGLYKCFSTGNNNDQFSHSINISVSDLHQEVKGLYSVADEPSGVAAAAAPVDLSWMPLFFCVSFIVLIVTLTAVMIGRIHRWKRVLIFDQTKGQEKSCSMIPELPKGIAPPISVLPTNFYSLNEDFSRPPSLYPPIITTVNQPAVPIRAQGGQRSGSSTINVLQAGGLAGQPSHSPTRPCEDVVYATVKISR